MYRHQLSAFFIGCILSFDVLSFDLIAHRGASGFLPEHSKEALVLAHAQGADYIEQDLVLSKDGHLMVLHDIHIDTVSNVEDVFPDRKREDGRYYAIDFTLAELRRLSLHERRDPQNKQVFAKRYRGTAHFTMSTFAEHVELINELNRQFATTVGWYPELKAPEWHLQQGQDIVATFVEQLNLHGLNNETAKIIIQSFEPKSLQRLKHDFAVKPKLIQLIAENSWQESSADYSVMVTREGLRDISKYADGVGPWLPHIVDLKNMQGTGFIALAKAQGLLVHAYTFRHDIKELESRQKLVFDWLANSGIDGIFSDHIMPYMRE